MKIGIENSHEKNFEGKKDSVMEEAKFSGVEFVREGVEKSKWLSRIEEGDRARNGRIQFMVNTIRNLRNGLNGGNLNPNLDANMNPNANNQNLPQNPEIQDQPQPPHGN